MKATKKSTISLNMNSDYSIQWTGRMVRPQDEHWLEGSLGFGSSRGQGERGRGPTRGHLSMRFLLILVSPSIINETYITIPNEVSEKICACFFFTVIVKNVL